MISKRTRKLKIYDKGVDVPRYTKTFADFQCSYRYGDIVIPNIRFAEPLRQECQHFLDCIQKHERPRTCGEEGLDVVRILETAQHSLMNGSHLEEVPRPMESALDLSKQLQTLAGGESWN